MSTYRAPLRDMQFVLRELAGIDEIAKLPGFEETPEVRGAILEEASTFATARFCADHVLNQALALHHEIVTARLRSWRRPKNNSISTARF